jgi:3-deoxy-manno-octulosonate cytidylyltransferase (CMP-KDO synthetase)
MLEFLGIIPARYASTRFPGKPLVTISGKTMIERVFIQATKVLKHVVVATDDDRIEAEVKRFGGKVIMTSPNHQSGTDRCVEAFEKYEKETGIKFDVVINIQGDEPLIQPLQFEKLMNCFDRRDTDIATLVKSMGDVNDIDNPNHVKVVLSRTKRALYFSRSPVPYLRHFPKHEWLKNHTFYKHIGIYAYRANVLKEITRLSQSELEVAESLEQLRWLENNYNISVEITEFDSISVDTPADLEKINTLKIQD